MVEVSNLEDRELTVTVNPDAPDVTMGGGTYTIKKGMNNIPDDVWAELQKRKFVQKRLTRKPSPSLLVIAAAPVAPPEPPKRGPGRPPKSDG